MVRTENPFAGRSGVNFRISSSGVGLNRLYPLLSGTFALEVVALGTVASSARAEQDNTVKPITSPAHFAARPQDTRPKGVRFLRNAIGVTWTGPGQACEADSLRESGKGGECGWSYVHRFGRSYL